MATGRIVCSRCRALIDVGDAWDLGHADDRTRYNGPEHADCNRSAAAKRLR